MKITHLKKTLFRFHLNPIHSTLSVSVQRPGYFKKDKFQYQQLMLTRGFQSSSDTRLHFGLDSQASLDSILIVWPDQKFQLLKNITANQRLTIN